MNFYAIFSLLLLLCVAFMGLDIGPMREHELNAQRGNLYDETKGLPPERMPIYPKPKRVRSLVYSYLLPCWYLRPCIL